MDREIDFSSEGWEAYQYSLNKRNSLAHPKYPKDLYVDDVDIVKIYKAEKWLMKEIELIFNGFASKVKTNQ